MRDVLCVAMGCWWSPKAAVPREGRDKERKEEIENTGGNEHDKN